MEIKGASLTRRLATKATCVVDMALPWLRIPYVPEVFRPFGLVLCKDTDGKAHAWERWRSYFVARRIMWLEIIKGKKVIVSSRDIT